MSPRACTGKTLHITHAVCAYKKLRLPALYCTFHTSIRQPSTPYPANHQRIEQAVTYCTVRHPDTTLIRQQQDDCAEGEHRRCHERQPLPYQTQSMLCCADRTGLRGYRKYRLRPYGCLLSFIISVCALWIIGLLRAATPQDGQAERDLHIENIHQHTYFSLYDEHETSSDNSTGNALFKRANWPSVTDADWEQALQRGHEMECETIDERFQRARPGHTKVDGVPDAKWTNYEDLNRYGWQRTDLPGVLFNFVRRIDAILPGLVDDLGMQVDVDEDDTGAYHLISWDHNTEPVTIDEGGHDVTYNVRLVHANIEYG